MDIVFSALTVTKTCPVTILGEDFNLLVLLFWHYNHLPSGLYSNSSKTAVDIKQSKQLLGDDLKQSILAINVFCGCDTTSMLHSVGSGTLLQKFLKNQEFRRESFHYYHQTEKTYFKLERKLLLLLGGKEKTLDELCVHKCYDKMWKQIRHLSKLKLLNPLQMLHSTMYFRYIRCRSWEGTMYWIP